VVPLYVNFASTVKVFESLSGSSHDLGFSSCHLQYYSCLFGKNLIDTDKFELMLLKVDLIGESLSMGVKGSL